MKLSNVFLNMPNDNQSEIFETIADLKNVRIERIISSGQATPAGQWYDQAQDEWVILLAGSAEISLEEQQETFKLVAGDYLLIPSHCRHRVECTDQTQQTTWLAVHVGEVSE